MFETFSSLFLVIVFLVPGYIWRVVESRFIYLYHRDPWEKFALGLVTRSTFIYLPFAPWFYLGWKLNWYIGHPWHCSGIAIVFIAVYPSIAGLLMGVGQQKKWLETLTSFRWVNFLLTKTHLHTLWYLPVPTAWEAVFNSKIQVSTVIVTRKNGEQIYGILGENSHISLDPDDRDIFISHVLFLSPESGNYEFVPGTKGVYICASEISTVELIEYNDESTTPNG